MNASTEPAAHAAGVSRARRLLAWLPLYPLLGGAVSLLGWIADLPLLTDWEGNGISIQPNAAVATMCAAGALLLLGRGRRRAAAALAVVVTVIGGTTLFQYLSGVLLGIDTLLMFDREWGRVGVLSPGRMGPPGALSWTLLGLGTFAAAVARGRLLRSLAAAAGLFTGAIATLSLVGYLYRAELLYTVPTLTVIALQTATFVFAVAIGLLLALPDRWPARLLGEGGVAGMLFRRAVPLLVLVPVAVGMVVVAGFHMHWYDPAFGSALRTLIEIGLLLLLVASAITVIRREEAKRRAAQAARTATDRRLSAILENMTDGFVTLDEHWRFTYVNPEAERMLRRTFADLQGRSLWETFPEVVGGVTERELRRAVATRTSVEFEDHDQAMGQWFANTAYATPDGGVAVLFQNVTERKKAKAELAKSREDLATQLAGAELLQSLSLELVQHGSAAALCERVMDAAMAIMRADCASMQALVEEDGLGPRLRLLGARGFGPGAAAQWQWVSSDSGSACGRALAGKERVVVTDVECGDFLGGTPALEMYRMAGVRSVQTTPLLARSGALVGMLSTHWRSPHEPLERDFQMFDVLARQAADLLERMRFEAQREDVLARERTARAAAEHVARMKDEFLATLSHELRTPLNAILGWTHILRQDLADPVKVEAAAEVLERNGRLQAQLIADMLDMSRIVSGKMRLEVQRIALADVVTAAVESLRPAALAKGVRIEAAVQDATTAVQGDPGRLQQVVWNLLSNAVKFTPRGGCVQVALARTDERAAIRVTDTGEGIPRDFLPRIFERFSQADGSASRPHGGLGIGLALVKELVELHGGRVGVTSDGIGNGATFTVELPLADLDASERTDANGGANGGSAGASGGAANAPAAGVQLRGLRVLLVDDEADALAFAHRLLADRGATVTTAASAAEALALLRGRGFDVIVSDIGMPGTDGYALLAEARHTGIGTPALALTAFARGTDRTKAMLAGYQAHLAKPVEAAELLATVAALGGRLRLPPRDAAQHVAE